MRNLKLIEACHTLPLPELSESHDISVDPDTGHVILVTASMILVLDPHSQQIVRSRSLLSDAAIPTEGEGHVIGVQYLPDQGGACFATSNGNLTMWTLNVDEFECMGSVDSGLTAMQWSPDQELVVLTTGAETVLLMTREFDPITEIPLHTSEFGEGEFVTVGWGKKETQFHGSEGKQAARKQKEDVQGTISWDDRKPRIRWRGDGQYFAVSSIHPDSGARYIRVWSREGALQSTSEPINRLGQALFWKPTGALIASTQQKPNKHDVVFFEKNGLQHGEFTLATGKEEFKVVEVLWNVESSALCVWGQYLPGDQQPKTPTAPPPSFVQLWTCSNYHWSMKQNLTFDSRHGNVSALIWDPEQAYRLHVVTSKGHYFQYTWAWATNHSIGMTSHDPASVFVIDGSSLKVTPMRKMVVPPPMSAYQLPLPSVAAQVVSPASPCDATGDVGVLTQDNQFLVFSCSEHALKTGTSVARLDAAGGQGFTAQCSMPSLQATYRLVTPQDVSEFPLCVTHICWPHRGVLVLSVAGDTGVCLYAAHLAQVSEDGTLPLGEPVPVEDKVISLSVDPQNAGCVAVQLSSGHVLRFTCEEKMVLPWETASGEELRFPFPCTQVEVTSLQGEEAVLGLTDRYRFYVNGVEVASNCTSFAVHDEFLLLTTLSHTVRCINRHTAVKDLPSLSDGKAHPFDESIRRVERGSRIVTVVAEDTKLVLQMPRGNLETVHPRALVLATVRRLLDRCEFGGAFSVMKKHRINLNLLYDHNPPVFLQQVSHFLTQIPSVTDINLFLTELQEDDVTVTMYTAAYSRTCTTPTTSSGETRSGKVDTVCDAIRAALEGLGADRFRLSILTSLVRKSQPQLQKALEMVWALRGGGEGRGGVSAEEALKYLLFLVDVNKLYNAALATYNFDLVLMVAEKSQKDPKEYIPFLNQLRRLKSNYCKFTIDRHLKNYSSALRHIALCGEDHFTECVSLVQEQKLYGEALKLFNPDSPQFKTLAKEYGDYLREKNRHDEAGVMYLRGEHWQLAQDAFVAALDWRHALSMATQMKWEEGATADLARVLAVRLKDTYRHSEAAVVYEQYARDVEEAIVTLVEGAQWQEALRLMYRYSRTDIIETHLKNAIAVSCVETMTMLESQQEEMEGYVKRLSVVRQEKERRRQQLWESDRLDNMNADLFSDTSSVTGGSIAASQHTINSNRSTVFSKMSGRSSRNRRKGEHKKWSLKEGSPFEDCALVDAIARIITATDAMRDQVKDLLHVLTQFHQVTMGEQLQCCYEGFLAAIERTIPLVWVPENDAASNMALGPGMTANTIAQAVQQGLSLDTAEKTEPVLKVPPKLKKDVRWKLHMLHTDN
ncbi:elongator complex protein 1-like isoform X2 [Babylonia areolata]|uniref:elongator complex protein 1-like isoform X2 n=1 Tax=Babylonia areolata TaxID=304850 RepID=UPI003FD5423E